MRKIMHLSAGLMLVGTAMFATFQASAHDHSPNGVAATAANTTLSFIENKGQWISDAKFKADIPGGVMFLTEKGFVYNYVHEASLNRIHDMTCGPNAKKDANVDNEMVKHHAYKVNFVGASANSTFSKALKRETYHNYYIGNESQQWASNVGLFGEVTQSSVYPGIDLKVYATSGEQPSIKYDFIVAPNVSPDQIKLSFEGVTPKLNANGDLKIVTSVNEVIEKAPYVYQIVDGKQKEVRAHYQLTNNVLSFKFPQGYDQSKPLVIDPDLIFATYSGTIGSSAQYANASAYDDLGCLFAAGLSYGLGWPVSAGSYQTTYSSNFTGCINKYSANGTQLLYSTYFGGNASSGKAMPNVMRVDAANNLVVAGTVSNATMPTTAGAFQTTMSGSSDIFVAKFNSTGTALLASTFLGGSGNEGSLVNSTAIYTGNQAQDNPVNPANIAFDNVGNIWISGNSGSTNFPVTPNAYQQTLGGSHDAVLVKMNSNLSNIIYASFFGGSAWDGGIGLEYNNRNNTVGMVGYTNSANFPTTAGAYHTTARGGIDAYALVLSNATYLLQASTYLGTSAADFATRLAFDCGNNVFVAGRTLGAYPVTNTAAEGLVANGYVFIDKLNPTLTGSIASTRTGAATSSVLPTAMMVDICGNILVATITNNSHQQNMPLTSDAFQTTPRGFYFAAFEPNFTGLAFGSYYGATSSTDHFHPGVSSRIDPKGVIYQSICYSGSNGNWTTAPANVYAPNKQNGSTNDIVSFKFDFQVVGLDAVSESGYAGYGSLPHAVRGCKSAIIDYTRNGDTTIPMVLRFSIPQPGGDIATNGVDYQFISDSLVFGPMERTKSLEIKPLLVPNMPTGPKMVIIESKNPCGCEGGLTDVIRRDTVFILDSIRVEIDQPLPAYCPGTQISITADVDPGLDFTWSPAEFNTGNLTINPTLLTSRNYTITAYQPGAPATCPPSSKTFKVLVEQFPKIHASSDTVVCIVDSVAIPVTASPDSVNYAYNWSPATGLRAANIGTNYLSRPPGVYNYSITATTPIANCQSTHNIRIEVRPPFQFSNVLPVSGTVVDYGEEINMSADGAMLYNWYPVDKFWDPTLQNATTTPIEEPGTYFVTGVDQYGCKDTAEIFIDVNYPHDPIMPNAFTPNGDGKNDVFAITNAAYQKIQAFQVYDRLGQLVFETSDARVGWDGRHKDSGKECSQGVYMYFIKLQLPNKEIKQYKGDITLFR